MANLNSRPPVKVFHFHGPSQLYSSSISVCFSSLSLSVLASYNKINYLFRFAVLHRVNGGGKERSSKVSSQPEPFASQPAPCLSLALSIVVVVVV